MEASAAMTRREWLVSAGGLLAGAMRISAQTPLSTRGEFLNWSNEEERCWFFSARDGLERFRRLAYAHPHVCALQEIARLFYGAYVKKPPMRFTSDQIAQWEATGRVLGSSLTDQGLDMWFDWDDTQGMETRATKNLLESVRPYCVVDFHNFMFPTEVFAPTVYSQGGWAEEERALALALQQTWRTRKLPFHDRPSRPYPKPAEKYYEDYWFHQLGARALIVEVNGGMLATEGAEYEPVPGERALTRRESLETVVAAVDTLVKQITVKA
jgi:hypothetical protein